MSSISDPQRRALVRTQPRERPLCARRLEVFLLAAALAGAVTSCAGMTPSPRPDALAVRFAPTPVERYSVTATFDELQDGVDDFSGVARFSVSNPGCVPLDPHRAFGGVRLAPRHAQPLDWRRGADGVYRAGFDLDALQDENYFGLGLCRWRFDGLEVRFVVGGAHFVHAIAANEVSAQRERRGYFLVRDIRVPRGDRAIFGEDVGFYRSDLGAQFVLTLEARQETRRE